MHVDVAVQVATSIVQGCYERANVGRSVHPAQYLTIHATICHAGSTEKVHVCGAILPLEA